MSEHSALLPRQGGKVVRRPRSYSATAIEEPDFDHGEKQRQSFFERVVTLVKRTRHPVKRYSKEQAIFESLDYEPSENTLELAYRRSLTASQVTRIRMMRWVIMFIIGILTAVVAIFIDTCIVELADMKFSWLHESINVCVKNDCLVKSYFSWIGMDILFVTVAASLVVFIEPIAQGSGIPEIKCYLNGIKMPHVVRLRTLVTKAVGVLFSVVGGLAIGKEGPMIHSGAVIAAGISQGKSTTLPFVNTGLFKYFRVDTEKRDFVSAGAAAGVSAAFGAPIGGVLFSLEEGASFWNQSLTWRTFFCSMTATFTLNVLLSGIRAHQWGLLSNPGLLNFGRFEDMPYNIFELPIFVLLGCCGGLFGALFVGANEKLSEFRMKFVTSKFAKLMEAITIAGLTASVAFTLIYFSTDCLPLGDSPETNPLQLFCKEHQYNAMATLFFNTPEESIKNLFHGSREEFSMGTLAMFFVAYFVLSCMTYGVAVPSGLFVPCILTGAAYGRFIGSVLSYFLPGHSWTEPGKYALIGAAAILGGVVRMTISLTVIVIEATGNVTYGLPIIVAVVFAKWVGDLFGEGIYDMHIHLKHVPILEWDPPALAKYRLTARDIMTRKIDCVRQLNRVGDIWNLLQQTPHSAFPVLHWDEEPASLQAEDAGLAKFVGTILRTQLVLLLKHRAFGIEGVQPPRVLPRSAFTDAYPRWPTIQDVEVSPDDLDKYVDLGPYLNPSPYFVFSVVSFSKIFRLFRTMGLRHLVIVNNDCQVVGVVTRKDLSNITSQTTPADYETAMQQPNNVEYLLPEYYR
eukprot:m.120580 g.120580  ORF g.120580 m.120580 type:complete len:797 (-) comp16508_c0_seq1:1550-3940(-)